MIFDRIIANIDFQNEVVSGVHDWLDLHWRECFARAARLQTRGGQQIRLLLPLGAQLRHGDVISDGKREIGVAVRPCQVLLCHPPDVSVGLTLALGLGNLHAPVQVDGEQLIVLPDGPVEELLESLGVAYSEDARRFEPTSIAAPLRAQLASQFRIVVRAAAEK
jgi:urease accessory protein UreE